MSLCTEVEGSRHAGSGKGSPRKQAARPLQSQASRQGIRVPSLERGAGLRAELPSAGLDATWEMHTHSGERAARGGRERVLAECSLLGGVPTFLSPCLLFPAQLAPPQAEETTERPGTLSQRALPLPEPRAPTASSCARFSGHMPCYQLRTPCPHLPTPCRSLSVLRQGAMARPGGQWAP